VNVRNRDDVGTKAKSEMIKLDDIIAKFKSLKSERRFENRFT
jgi:threonyl-tRNA synthetase